MPASITLSGLSYSTPDGRPLFDHLDIAFGAERTGLVGRNGVGKSTLIRLIAGELHIWGGAAWTNAGPIQGPPGPPGHPGQIRVTGNGAPPAVIVGAEPGDTYLDLDTGDIYKLTY